jgi:predicted  nucleic acid-binding Zn-ribbon protein
MSEPASETATLAVAQAEVRMASVELEKWQTAYDSYRGEDAQRFHAEIRAAEERLHKAHAALRDLRRKARP